MEMRGVDNVQCTFGTDSEFLVLDEKDRPVPAHKVKFPSAKRKLTLPGYDDSKAFRDGYAVEINVRPATCRQTLTFTVQRALHEIVKMLPPGHKLATLPAWKIDLKQMANAPSDVKQFGCKPSLCAYTGAQKIPPIDAMTHPWRYSGAHLHFSALWEEDSYIDNDYVCAPDPKEIQEPDVYPDFAKLMDLYMGLPLTCLFHSEALYQRRRFYGQAGEYRVQNYGQINKRTKAETPIYGFEYRVPGPELWNLPWVSSLAMSIGRYVINNRARLMKRYDKNQGEAVRNAINTGEDRWKLLRWLPGSRYTPSMWRHLYLHKPYESTPYTLMEAQSNVVTDGFYHWFTKTGKLKPRES